MIKPSRLLRFLPATLGAALLASCSSPPPSQPGPGMAPPTATTPPVDRGAPTVSQARDPRSYRADAAQHLYGMNRDRIMEGAPAPDALRRRRAAG